MKLSDLIVENSEKQLTGSKSLDKLFNGLSPDMPTMSLSLPVDVRESSWEMFQNPERISKTFIFSSLEKQRYFLNELLTYQEEIQHHALVTINAEKVTVETYTHDVNGVTEIDKELSDFCDEVYEDTRFF